MLRNVNCQSKYLLFVVYLTFCYTIITVKKEARIEKILKMLQKENGLQVQVLSRNLDVSHMTVRRDLEQMVSEDQVRLIHGGVILSQRFSAGCAETPYSLHTAGAQHSESKQLIGIRAAALIENHDTLIIDSGSTTECLAASISSDLQLTILSYSLNVITKTACMGNIRSVFAGGNLHLNTLMFESPEGISMIQRYRATKAFISAAGITQDFGVTCRNAYERETKKAVIESSVQKILVADSSKFGMIRSEYFADLSSFDTIVTDQGLSREHRNVLRELSIELIIA